MQRFAATIGSQPAVVEAHYVAGEADVLLKLQVADIAAYDKFIDMHVSDSPLVGRFKTFTTLRRLTA